MTSVFLLLSLQTFRPFILVRASADLVASTPRRLVAAAQPPRFFLFYIYIIRCHRYLHVNFQEDLPQKKLKTFHFKICCIVFDAPCTVFEKYFFCLPGSCSRYERVSDLVFSIASLLTIEEGRLENGALRSGQTIFASRMY